MASKYHLHNFADFESCCDRFLLFKSDIEILVVWWPPSTICLTLLILNFAVEGFFCLRVTQRYW